MDYIVKTDARYAIVSVVPRCGAAVYYNPVAPQQALQLLVQSAVGCWPYLITHHHLIIIHFPLLLSLPTLRGLPPLVPHYVASSVFGHFQLHRPAK